MGEGRPNRYGLKSKALNYLNVKFGDANVFSFVCFVTPINPSPSRKESFPQLLFSRHELDFTLSLNVVAYTMLKNVTNTKTDFKILFA